MLIINFSYNFEKWVKTNYCGCLIPKKQSGDKNTNTTKIFQKLNLDTEKSTFWFMEKHLFKF